jgi:hypothetical protein
MGTDPINKRDCVANNRTGQICPGKSVKQKASYLLARFAGFFFGFGVKGAGGAFSIRRNTSSPLGLAACLGLFIQERIGHAGNQIN